MVMLENGRNLPESLGHRNLPPKSSWGNARIGPLPSVIGLISDRSMLLPQGSSLIGAMGLRTKAAKLRRAVFPGASQNTGVIIGQESLDERNVPFPWLSKAPWPSMARVGNLPSVIATLLEGPSRSVSPQSLGSKISLQKDTYNESARAERSRHLAVSI